jgi:DNA-binding FadR family transcriptional regulator
MTAIFTATHNQVFQQLARPLLNLRNLRSWADDEESTAEDLIAVERRYIQQLLAALTGRDADQARAIVTQLMVLPPAAIAAMRQTPVGEMTEIPIPLPKLSAP